MPQVDNNAVARLLGRRLSAVRIPGKTGYCGGLEAAIDGLTVEFADLFSADDPQFNRDEFYRKIYGLARSV